MTSSPGATPVVMGRELDALIAEKVMGWSPTATTPNGTVIARSMVFVPNYSTEIAAAWRVHLAVCEGLFSARLRYFAALQEQTRLDSGALVAWPDVLVVLRDRMPEAICRAALLAVGAA